MKITIYIQIRPVHYIDMLNITLVSEGQKIVEKKIKPFPQDADKVIMRGQIEIARYSQGILTKTEYSIRFWKRSNGEGKLWVFTRDINSNGFSSRWILVRDTGYTLKQLSLEKPIKVKNLMGII